jgi:hypothetical protein
VLWITALLCVPTAAHADFVVTGTAARDEALTMPWRGCTVTATISVVYDGVPQPSVTCNRQTGAFSANVVTSTPDKVLAVYFNSPGMDPTAEAVTYTRPAAATGTVTGLNVIQSRVSLSSRSATVLQLSAVGQWDKGEDPVIPISGGTLDAGHELHIAPGTAAVSLNVPTYAPKIHVASGAVVTQDSYTRLTSGGIADCAAGPPLMRPLCVDPGGSYTQSVTSFPSSDRIEFLVDVDSVIDTVPTYQNMALGASSTVLPRTLRLSVGTATGQTLNATSISVSDCFCTGEVVVDGSQFDPNWNVGDLFLGRNATVEQDGPATMTLASSPSGSGYLDMPKTDVTVDAVSGRDVFGPASTMYGGHYGPGQRWHVRNLTLRSNEDRPTLDSMATGEQRTNVGTGLDEWVASVNQDCCSTLMVGNSSTNGGDWLVGWHSKGNGTETYATLNTAGSNVDRVSAAYRMTIGGVARLVVVGSTSTNGGDWAVGVFDVVGLPIAANAGWGTSANANETMLNGVRTWNSGGTQADSAAGAFLGTNASGQVRIYVAGTGGMNGGDWVVRSYDPLTGAFDQMWTWNTGGSQSDRLLVTSGNVLGGSAGTNGGDFALRTFDADGADAGWQDTRTLAGGACVEETGTCTAGLADCAAFGCRAVWNSGGTNADVITAYSDPGYDEDDVDKSGAPSLNGFSWWCGAHAAGTTSSGGATDWYLSKWCEGALDPSFSSDGQLTWDSGGAGDDTPYGIWVRTGEVNVFGQAGTNNGDMAWGRWDFDGDPDTALTAGGVLVTGGAGVDRFRGATNVYGGIAIQDTSVVFGTNGTSNGGETSFRAYDYDGTLRTGSTTGATIFMPMPGERGSVAHVRVDGDLTIGSAAGDTAKFDLDHADMLFDVGGDVRVLSTGWLRASTETPLRIGGTLHVDGTFLHENGVVEFVDASKTSAIELPAGTQLGTLRNRTPRKWVTLPNASTLTVGVLDLGGTSCSDRARLSNTSGATTASIVTGSATVDDADINNVTTAPARTATNSVGTGTTTGWTFTGACAALSARAPAALYTAASSVAAQAGATNPTGIATATPWFSLVNRDTSTVDKYGAEVWSDLNDSKVLGLWHLDQSGTTADPNAGAGSTGCGSITPTATATYVTGRAGLGSAIQTDGTAGSTATASSSCTITSSYTVDARVRLDPAATCTSATNTMPVFLRDSGANAAFRIGVACDASSAAGSVWATVRTNGTPVRELTVTSSDGELLDHAWHHVALSVDDDANLVSLLVDGEQKRARTSTAIFRGDDVVAVAGVTPQVSCSSGCAAWRGAVDEVRIASDARSAAELRGFMRTGMPHGARLWDADGAGDLGVAMSACAAGARCASTQYAGPASILRSGARWWVTSRFVRQGSSTWTDWSRPDWFEATGSSSITLSVTTGLTMSMGTVLAGDDVSGELTARVQSSNEGYQLLVSDDSDTWALTNGFATIADWTGTATAPTTWVTGASNAFGMTVLGVNGSKGAADQTLWGVGTVATDYANLKYAGLRRGALALVASRTDATAPSDDVRLGFRGNVSASMMGGLYAGHVQLTAVANP